LSLALWFPRAWSGVEVLIVPLLWLMRRVAVGLAAHTTVYDRPIAVLVCWIPASLLPIVDLESATPRIQQLLLGIGLSYALGGTLSGRRSLRWATGGAALILGAGISLAGLFGGGWKGQRISGLAALYEHLPLLVQGVSRYGERGTIHPNEIGG